MIRAAILISGGGTTAEATLKACQNGKLTGITPYIISSNSAAKGNDRAKNLGITPYIIDRKKYSKEQFDQKLLELLDQLRIELITLQGWLHLVSARIVAKYNGKIFNQHPGAMDPGRPDFGGPGMSTPYRVNSALLAYNWVTGENLPAESDTHFVTEEFDKGDLIRCEKMEIPAKENLLTIEQLRKSPKQLIEATHTVQKEFYPVEHHNVIATLQLFADKKAKPIKRGKPLIREEFIGILEKAKKLAIELFPAYNL